MHGPVQLIFAREMDQRLHVVGPLQRARIGTFSTAHASLELFDGRVIMFVKPPPKFID
jgi:hypothetical protein